MKTYSFIAIILCFGLTCSAQKKKKNKTETLSKEATQELLSKIMSENNSLKMAANDACKCIDSLSLRDKRKSDIATEIHDCIEKEVMSYQLMAQLFSNVGDTAKSRTILINDNKESDSYKKYYYEIERYLMDSCASATAYMAADNKESQYSFSKNEQAIEYYNKGTTLMNEEKYEEALKEFKAAVTIDPKFAFCWDHIGICNRRLKNYEEALIAYKKSLEIDPNGATPLQNIPIVYESLKKYPEAIEAYKTILKKQPNNPEGYYGMSRIFALDGDFEEATQKMCKAYLLYIEQKSPYRTDAEKMMGMYLSEMKKVGNEKRFYEILKENKIDVNEK